MDDIQQQQKTHEQVIQNLQNAVAELHQQLQNASQAFMNLSTKNNSLRTARPENFNGRNVRSWLKSIQNVIETEKTAPTEEQKIKFAVNYVSGDGLQWWELININKHNSINTFEDFKRELLKYFEPVNREINARKST